MVEAQADREPIVASTVLDRPLNLAAITWATAVWVLAAAVAAVLRLAQLDLWALAPEEARRAYDAWLLYQGRPPLPGADLPTTSPLFLLLEAFSFFLFGTTDVTARLVPALAGLALVALTYALRPFVGAAAALGMALLAAFSPTLVYASRTATPEIVVACLSLLLVVAVLHAGREGAAGATVRRWAVVAGVTLGALIAAGPSSISVLIGLAVGGGVATMLGENAFRRGLAAVARTPGAALAAVAAFAATTLALFTRLFSEPAAIVGLGHTVAEWARLVAEGFGGTPTQFFLLALLLYEPLAVFLALVAALRGRVNPTGGAGWSLFGGWFLGALVLWSFSAGRAPEHAVHVALPLVLLGGGVLGELVADLDRRDLLRGAGGALAVALLGLFVGLIALGILLSRIDGPVAGRSAAASALIVAVLVVVPLGYAVFTLVQAERATGRGRQPALLALLVPALLLGAFTLRSSILLSFYRADEGTELLAQRTVTEGIRPAVERLRRLSRDVTVTQGSVRDTTGGHGLSIAAERTVRWPFQW